MPGRMARLSSDARNAPDQSHKPGLRVVQPPASVNSAVSPDNAR